MPRLGIGAAFDELAGGPSVQASKALREIEKIASKVRLGRGQAMDFTDKRSKPVLVVRSGFLVVRMDLNDGLRVGALLVPPGGVVRLSDFPLLGPLMIAAGEATVLLRLEDSQLDQLVERDSAVRSYVLSEARRQFCYDRGHVALLTAVRGDERVAGFLLETARSAGRNGSNGDVIDMPISRTDLAHHLALNPDTLSRIVSRFKARGLIAMPNRRSFRILDTAGLAELSPVGRSLMASPLARPVRANME